MDKLIAKEVEFNGDILKAAQDPDGIFGLVLVGYVKLSV